MSLVFGSQASTILVLELKHVFGGGKMLKYQDWAQTSCQWKMANGYACSGFRFLTSCNDSLDMPWTRNCTDNSDGLQQVLHIYNWNSVSKYASFYIYNCNVVLLLHLYLWRLLEPGRDRKRCQSHSTPGFFLEHCQLTLDPLPTS